MKENFNQNPIEYRNKAANELKAVRNINKEIAVGYLEKIKDTDEYQRARLQIREENILNKKLSLDKEISIKDYDINFFKAEATLQEIEDPKLKSKIKLEMLKELASHGDAELLKKDIDFMDSLTNKVDAMIFIAAKEGKHDFKEIVELAKKEYDESGDEKNYSNLRKITQAQALRGDINGMMETINIFDLSPGYVDVDQNGLGSRRITVKDDIYKTIAETLIKVDRIDDVKKIIEHPKYDGYKKDIIELIYKDQISKENFYGALQTIKEELGDNKYLKTKVLTLMAEKEGKGDFEEAKRAAREIDSTYGSADLLTLIAEKEGRGDFEEAIKVAKKRTNLAHGNPELDKIIQAQISYGDFDGAKEILQHEDNDYKKSLFIGLIAKAQVKRGDLDSALKNCELVHAMYKDHILIEIAAPLVENGQVEEAKKTLENVNAVFFEDQTKELNILLDIAEKEGKGDFERAKELAGSDSNQYRKPRFFSLIAEKEGKGDFEEAKKWAEITRRKEDWEIISLAQARSGDIDGAIETAKKTNNIDASLLNIVEVMTQKNIMEQAKKVTAIIKDSYLKTKAQIFIGILEHDFTEAKIEALKIQDKGARDYMLGVIATYQFKDKK